MAKIPKLSMARIPGSRFAMSKGGAMATGFGQGLLSSMQQKPQRQSATIETALLGMLMQQQRMGEQIRQFNIDRQLDTEKFYEKQREDNKTTGLKLTTNIKQYNPKLAEKGMALMSAFPNGDITDMLAFASSVPDINDWEGISKAYPNSVKYIPILQRITNEDIPVIKDYITGELMQTGGTIPIIDQGDFTNNVSFMLENFSINKGKGAIGQYIEKLLKTPIANIFTKPKEQ